MSEELLCKNCGHEESKHVNDPDVGVICLGEDMSLSGPEMCGCENFEELNKDE